MQCDPEKTSLTDHFLAILQGPDPLNSDEPARLGKDLTDDERKEIVLMAYNQLQDKFKTLMKPDGSAESPAKTCRDLAAAYPDKENGQSGCTLTTTCNNHKSYR